MLGLVIATLILAYQAFYINQPIETAYVEGTGFLYQWYWFWTGIALGIQAVIYIAITFGGAALAAVTRGNAVMRATIGLALFVIGGSASLFGLVFTAIRVAMQLGGAWLLMTAGTPLYPFAEFDMKKMVVGGLMVLISALFFRASASGSSSSSSSSASPRSRVRGRGGFSALELVLVLAFLGVLACGCMGGFGSFAKGMFTSQNDAYRAVATAGYADPRLRDVHLFSEGPCQNDPNAAYEFAVEDGGTAWACCLTDLGDPDACEVTPLPSVPETAE